MQTIKSIINNDNNKTTLQHFPAEKDIYNSNFNCSVGTCIVMVLMETIMVSLGLSAGNVYSRWKPTGHH